MENAWMVSSAVGIFLLACLSPGPVWAIITSTAISGSRRHAILTGFGVAAATFCWSTITMLGIGAVFSRHPWLQAALRYSGAAYLIWLGATMVASSFANSRTLPAGSLVKQTSEWGAFSQGYMASITNPKAAAFFLSLFVAIFPPNASAAVQTVTVAALSAASAAWHCGLAFIFSTPSIQNNYLMRKPLINAIIGLVLLGVAIRMLVSP
jgi:threonine/homoserine/homoserine lactone efflux protein